MDWHYYILFWVCIAGLCLGSFYNVVILRSLSNESIVFPPSKCPKCGHKLYAWHNIPVLSYILLRGKCYFCKEKISIQYPIVELLTMVMFGLTFLKFGISLKTLFVLIWVSGLIIMTVTDLKEKVVDCNIAIIMGVLGILYNVIAYGWRGLGLSLLGLLGCVIALELFARSGYPVAKTRAMGEADTYVAGALGAIFGLYGVIPVLLYSLICSLVIIIPIFFYKKFKNGDRMICFSAIIFGVFTGIYYYFPSIISLALLALSGVYLAIRVIKNIGRGDVNYFPFVPALFAGAVICFCTLI